MAHRASSCHTTRLHSFSYQCEWIGAITDPSPARHGVETGTNRNGFVGKSVGTDGCQAPSALDRVPGERTDMTTISSGSVQRRPVPVTSRIRFLPDEAQIPSRIRWIVVHPARIGERPECACQREAQGCRCGICDMGSDQIGREQLLNEEYQSIGQTTGMVAAVSGMTGC